MAHWVRADVKARAMERYKGQGEHTERTDRGIGEAVEVDVPHHTSAIVICSSGNLTSNIAGR